LLEGTPAECSTTEPPNHPTTGPTANSTWLKCSTDEKKIKKKIDTGKQEEEKLKATGSRRPKTEARSC